MYMRTFLGRFIRQELAFTLGELSLECPRKKRKKPCPFASLKKAKNTKIWGDQAVQHRMSEVFQALSDHGSYF